MDAFGREIDKNYTINPGNREKYGEMWKNVLNSLKNTKSDFAKHCNSAELWYIGDNDTKIRKHEEKNCQKNLVYQVTLNRIVKSMLYANRMNWREFQQSTESIDCCIVNVSIGATNALFLFSCAWLICANCFFVVVVVRKPLFYEKSYNLNVLHHNSMTPCV